MKVATQAINDNSIVYNTRDSSLQVFILFIPFSYVYNIYTTSVLYIFILFTMRCNAIIARSIFVTDATVRVDENSNVIRFRNRNIDFNFSSVGISIELISCKCLPWNMVNGCRSSPDVPLETGEESIVNRFTNAYGASYRLCHRIDFACWFTYSFTHVRLEFEILIRYCTFHM